MYVHIGKDLVVKAEDIIGIFNLDYIGNTKEYKNFKSNLEEQKLLKIITPNLGKTFILTENLGKSKAYITNIGASTIGKRKKELGGKNGKI
ncbi:MAG: DUF370 domain-containing protein [Clostridia bacterium]